MLGLRAKARLVRSRSALFGLAIVGALVLFAWVGPLAAQHGPLESDFARGITPEGLPVAPNRIFLLGADRLFRDVWARLAFAGRWSLLISVTATAMATCIGTAVGVVAGWNEGHRAQMPWPLAAGMAGAAGAVAFGRVDWALAGLGAAALATLGRRFRGPSVDVDGLMMRMVDVLLAFPFLLLVMAIGAAVDRVSATTILVTLGATGWLGIARVVRAKTIQVRSHAYVVASRALGQSTFRILLSHVLPGVSGPILVSATILVGQMIVAESVLSYLGVGISPPTPTWGRMLFEGQESYAIAPWLVIAPGAIILVAVSGFHMLGEGLRDALDPHET